MFAVITLLGLACMLIATLTLAFKGYGAPEGSWAANMEKHEDVREEAKQYRASGDRAGKRPSAAQCWCSQ